MLGLGKKCTRQIQTVSTFMQFKSIMRDYRGKRRSIQAIMSQDDTFNRCLRCYGTLQRTSSQKSKNKKKSIQKLKFLTPFRSKSSAMLMGQFCRLGGCQEPDHTEPYNSC